MGRLDDLERLKLHERAKWRRWLDKNHASSPGVWLVSYKVSTGKPTVSYEEAVEEALCFGWIDTTVRSLGAEKHEQLFVPRKATSTWSRTNKERVARLSTQGLMKPAGLAAVEIAKQNGAWSLLEPIEALVVPDDLAAALAKKPRAKAFFDSLSPTSKRVILRRVYLAKRPETRAKWVNRCAELAAQGELPE